MSTSSSLHPSVKAFGKFDPRAPSSLRSFERRLGISGRDGVYAWKSRIYSVQNLLDHLGRYTKSECSREKYLRHLAQFCHWSGLDPDKLVGLSKREAELLVQEFADELVANDCSRAYVNTVIKRLRTFFRVNGYSGNKELNVQRYFVPTRYRKIPEYIPTNDEVHSMADAAGGQRNRAIVHFLWTSGLRVSTCCALNYGDLANDLENGEPYVKISVYPKMKKRVADACKGLVSYYTFVSPETTEALRSYFREREEKYGKISFEDPLFYSDWTLWSRMERSSKRLGRRGIGLIVKKAAKLAGIKQWKHVTPHCLRKAFESVLRSPTIDGSRLDKGTQEFLMGHILPGSQDAYYDKTKVDFHRREYAKLDFSRSGISSEARDILIDISKLEEHLKEGWMFVSKVSDQKIVIRRTKGVLRHN